MTEEMSQSSDHQPEGLGLRPEDAAGPRCEQAITGSPVGAGSRGHLTGTERLEAEGRAQRTMGPELGPGMCLCVKGIRQRDKEVLEILNSAEDQSRLPRGGSMPGRKKRPCKGPEAS